MEGQEAIRLIDLDDGKEMLELLALQTAAYIKEAEMIGLTDIPPLLESPATVRNSNEAYYGLYAAGKLEGAIALKEEQSLWASAGAGDCLHICRLMVQPNRLRQGIASRLVGHAVDLARRSGLSASVLAVSTNQAAVSLYIRYGFRTIRQHPAANGLVLNEMVYSL